MAQKNGYIQVEIRGNEAIGHIHLPVDGGEGIDAREMERYFQQQNITGYDVRKFRDVIMRGTETEISLGECQGLEFSESMDLMLSPDHMSAVARFYPPSLSGNTLNIQDILGELKKNRVVFGLCQDTVMSFLNERCYATDYVIAKGQPPVQGSDAAITYFFNTNPDLKPHHNEDGSVDYHDLNTVCEINKGDLLARLTPGVRGVPGKDVLGKPIPARNIKMARLEYGRNIQINEEKTEIYSQVCGHVSLINDKVFVSDVFDVPADVDNSTGDIDYNGNVHVHGNVHGGFTIIAQGDVVVDGVVEDAMIQATGQIIVKCGIHGKNKGILDAGSNVICKFIENAKVFAGGYVETASILYSEINAGSDVIVNEKKGFITGGVIRAGQKVESFTVGSNMGATTKIEVGVLPEKKDQYQKLQKTVPDLKQQIDKVATIIRSYQKSMAEGKRLDAKNMQYLNSIVSQLAPLKKEYEEQELTYQKLHKELLMETNSRVIVRRDIFPGVIISIADVSYTLKEKRSSVEFVKKDGSISAVVI